MVLWAGLSTLCHPLTGFGPLLRKEGTVMTWTGNWEGNWEDLRRIGDLVFVDLPLPRVATKSRGGG
jgi:hypothetical protein